MQFYDDEAFLFETVALFVRSALDSGDAAVVIATPAHTSGILNQLGKPLRERALSSGQLLLIDAEALLARFMLSERPGTEPFFEAIDRMLALLTATLEPGRCVRAFGEMVDILWRQGKRDAAIELEKLWNQVTATHEVRLLCAYTMRDFYKSEDSPQFAEVCHLHTHVLPTETFARDKGDGFERLRQISALEQQARLLPSEIQYREELEGALREALAARSRVEFELKASVQREREARLKAGTSETLNAVLVRLLEPLDTLLTTCHLINQSRDVSVDAGKLARLATAGARVQRLLETIVGMTQTRLARGGSVPSLGWNVVSLVQNVVEDEKQHSPGARIAFAADAACFARVDSARVRQVVATLVRNATEHGDSTWPISVQVAGHGLEVKIRVHNYGRPIAAEKLPNLFQPAHSRAPSGKDSEGFVPSLHAAKRIVADHGGRLEVTSSLEEGTAFEVWLPS